MKAIIPYIIFVVIYFIISKLARKIIRKVFSKQKKLLAFDFLLQLLNTIIYFIVFLMIVSQLFPIEKLFSTLMTGSGLLVVVLTFISQEAIANVINGMLILFSNAFEIDDIITIPEKNIVGRIQSISLQHTEIVSFENNLIFVPNKIMNSMVIDRRRFNRLICNFLYFYVDYNQNLDLIENICKKIIKKHPYYIDQRTEKDIKDGKEDIGFVINSLDERGIQIRLSIWSLAENGFYMCSDLRKEILQEFQKNKIRMPHQQIDISFPKRTQM